MQNDEIIRLDSVCKTYAVESAPVRALRGVSFSVKQGEFLSIVGPSGSGKSTCMNLIGCLEYPSSGAIFINGVNTATMNEKELAVLRNKTIGFVFQQYCLLPALSMLENVMLPLRYSGVPVAERRERACAVLERVGLSDRLKHRPTELSGGQKQRAAIARAVVTNPAVILADEPTGALDSESGLAVLELFREINKNGAAVIIVTHDMSLARKTRRQICIFDGLVTEDISRTNDSGDLKGS